jgi:hypothetical protein
MTLRRAISALLVLGAVLFTIGVTKERSQHTEAVAAPSATTIAAASGEAVEAAEGAGHVEAAGHIEAPGGAETGSGEGKVFGINIESNGALTLAIVASLLVAAAVLVRRQRVVLLVAGLFALIFMAFDVGEVARQRHSTQSLILAIAVIVGLVHLAAAGLSFSGSRQQAG